MKQLVTFIFLLLISGSCFTASELVESDYEREKSVTYSEIPDIPGACFARCMIQDKFEISHVELIVFTGDEETTDAAIETIDHIVAPATTKWIKKKVDKDCFSLDPDDCLVWCIVAVPAEIKRVTIVTDTTTTDDFQILDFEKKNVIEKSGKGDWREVLCEKDVDERVMESIQNALNTRGYYDGPINGIMTKVTRKALGQFQMDNGYPIGQLDFESLDGLGLAF